jgi:7,8-dihydropterin-6-yl-methyl-4-(beta-D-ribofuranosyl)aminobenzene 5'-phosphate synthase
MEISTYRKCDSVTVSLLVENTARGAGILGEHGLCWCLRHGGKQLLFDLGQGMVLLQNARRMGVDLAATDALVFSHGHYDHVGGWPQVASSLSDVAVFLHPHALDAKFQKRRNGRMDTAGDAGFAPAMEKISSRVSASTEPCELIPGVWMTGQVPRRHPLEDTGGDFYCGAEAGARDDLLDDQSVFFRTDEGIVVVLGCAHAGVVNTLDYVAELTDARIHAVLGGMHLLHADAERMRFTVEALTRIDPDYLAPNHCTGDFAVAQLWQAFPGRVFEMHAGQSATFPKARPTLEEKYHAKTL